jgi:hypothetical protein
MIKFFYKLFECFIKNNQDNNQDNNNYMSYIYVSDYYYDNDNFYDW